MALPFAFGFLFSISYGFIDENGEIGKKQISEAGYNVYWNKEDDLKLYDYYSQLAEIRDNNEVLRTAGVEFETIKSEPKVVIIKREDKNGKIFTILNAADSEKNIKLEINNRSQIEELLTGEQYQIDSGKLELKLNAFSAEILKIKE